MPTWESWLQGVQVTGDGAAEPIAEVLKLPPTVRTQEWKPSAADRKAAWELYTELRTRIATQPLHYTEGYEPGALTSIADLFAMSRELMRKHGREARHFATLVTFLLNRVVRPFTARWHKEMTAGSLANEDMRHEFRERLLVLQSKLRVFGAVIGKLAEGDAEFAAGSESWPQPGQPEGSGRTELGADIPFDRLLIDSAVAQEVQQVQTEILNAESAEVRARRNAMQPPAADQLQDLRGLAISGGGLRSATFALGAVQALAEKNMLGQFDYLSTVSGGGYLGSFLSSYLNTPAEPDREATDNPGLRDQNVGPDADQHPFQKPAVGESAALRHLRSQSKFLLNGGTPGRFRMVLQALFGMLTNVAIVFPWIAIVVLLAHFWMRKEIHHATDLEKEYHYGQQLYSQCSQKIVSGFLAALLVVLPIVLRATRRERLVKWGTSYLWLTTGALVAFLVVTVWNSIPTLFRVSEYLAQICKDTSWLPEIAKSPWMALISPAILHAIGRIIGVAGREQPWTIALKKLITRIAGPLFLLVVFALLGRAIILRDDEPVLDLTRIHADWSFNASQLLLLITVAFLVYDHIFLDINLSSLHPFYRARLGEAYLVQHLATNSDDVTPADRTKLSELRRTADPRAPYHLLNAALNSPAGTHKSLRGRHCDFFLFSKHFCGSASTGYDKTTEFEKLDPALNLGTAMAISGAAASPFMGTGSGETSFLLALFNIRLDYWLRFPGRLALPLISWKPGPVCLAKQLLGSLHERSNYINLSDGGHIENLAIYELLRRRCKFIVAIDGECDPMITCGSLLTLINYAKIDFGIDIKFTYAGGLDRLKPTSLHTKSLTEKHAGEAAEPKASEASDTRATKVAPVLRSPMLPYHFALARIEYPATADTPPGTKLRGWLLYLKSSLTGNEGPTISYYRSKYPAFPHESTSDLFYDEEQFEAYRSLGHHIAEDVFRAEITGQQQSPTTIRQWFETLKDKMTNPNAL